jgi:hypothetical protein
MLEMTAEPAMPTSPALPLRWSWLRAALLAAAAVYGPQLLMGFYTLASVSCGHCRATVWKMMAVAPGVELAVLPSMLFKFHCNASNDAVALTVVSALSLLALAGVAVLLRHSSRRRCLIFTLFALAFSAGAALLLAMIRA